MWWGNYYYTLCKKQNWVYVWINSLKFYTVYFLLYTNLRTIEPLTLNLYKAFLKKQKQVFFFLSFAKTLYIFFYPSYVSICKDLQKTIVLSSGPFLQVFTFTIQCICNLWWSESSPSEAIPYTQKHNSNKAAAMHLCWNHTTAWVPPPPVDSLHMP